LKTKIHVAVAILVAGMVATSAAAAATPNRAKTLALQKSDFPAGAVGKNAAGTATAAASGYGVTYHYRSGGRPMEASIAVTVFKSRAMAVEMFKELRTDLIPGIPKLKLPRYGDEQVADHSVLGGSRLIVRKGSVVWYLEPQTYMVRAGKEYELTRAQTVAFYKVYAAKQARKVAAG
jgi:hypothetical protein